MGQITAVPTEQITSLMASAVIDDSDFPTGYYFELTPTCNNRCVGCFNVWLDGDGSFHSTSVTNRRSVLSEKEWETIIRKIQEAKAVRCVLTGGEPTLYQEFYGVIRSLDSAGLEITVLSNGRWAHPEKMIRSVGDLHAFKGFVVSLHGSTALSHEALTGVHGSFGETVSNIKLAISAGITVGISAVITKWNAREIEAIQQLGRDLGVQQVIYSRYLGLSQPDIEPSDRALARTLLQVERLKKRGADVRFGNCMPQCFAPNSSRACGAGETFLTVDPWGYVRPCNHSPIIVGNLITQDVQDVWQNMALDRWRGLVPKECKGCFALSICKGGCRAMIDVRGCDRMVRKRYNAFTWIAKDLIWTIAAGGVSGLLTKTVKSAIKLAKLTGDSLARPQMNSGR